MRRGFLNRLRSVGAAFSGAWLGDLPSCTPGAAGGVMPTPRAALAQPSCTRLAHEVQVLLGQLGTTPGQVAESLGAAGAYGVPGQDPPVAAYLTAVVGADPNVKSVEVGDGAAVVELRAWWRSAVTVTFPAAVRELAAAFDAGCYPSLDRREHRSDR